MGIRRPSARHLFLLTMLCGAAYGAMHGLGDDDAVALPAARAARAGEPAAPGAPGAPLVSPDSPLAAPQREALAQAPRGELFAATSWLPPAAPPPPPAKAPPPPPPSAPPLPYRFVGLLEDRSSPTAFLARGEALHVVTAGQIVDDVYRVESVSPAEIVLTYLPLRQRQTLPVSGASS